MLFFFDRHQLFIWKVIVSHSLTCLQWNIPLKWIPRFVKLFRIPKQVQYFCKWNPEVSDPFSLVIGGNGTLDSPNRSNYVFSFIAGSCGRMMPTLSVTCTVATSWRWSRKPDALWARGTATRRMRWDLTSGSIYFCWVEMDERLFVVIEVPRLHQT